MKRVLVLAAAAMFICCGGDEVRFDIDSPPPWLKKLESSLPSTPLRRGELVGDCVGQPMSQCNATVRASKSMARKAKFSLSQGTEVKITYTPNEKANALNITLRKNRDATVPVRRSGGQLTFRCVKSFEPCVVLMQ